MVEKHFINNQLFNKVKLKAYFLIVLLSEETIGWVLLLFCNKLFIEGN